MVCFAYGLPNKPGLPSNPPHGLSLPKVPKGDRLWQRSEACPQRVDADDNGLHPATERDLNRVMGQTHQHHGRQ